MVKVVLVGAYPWKMTRLRLVANSLKKHGFNVDVFMPKVNIRFRPVITSAFLRYLAFIIQELSVNSEIIHFFNIPDVYGFSTAFKEKLQKDKINL